MPKFYTWTGRKFFLPELQQAYRQIPALVLKDLADYCKVYHVDGSFDPDPHIHARNEGRRQVFQRVLNHIHLDDQQIMALMMDRPINYKEE